MVPVAGHAVFGVVWSLSGRVLTQGIRFGVFVVLARLLLPEQFGLFGMVVVFTGFAALFVDVGLGSAIVQRATIDERALSTAFWMNGAAGAAVGLLAAAFAPAIAAFYQEPRLALLVYGLSPTFLLNGLAVVPRGLLARRLEFRQLAAVNVVSAVVAAIVAITAAAAGAGAFSLAAYVITEFAVASLLAWTASGWRPSTVFDSAEVRSLWSFGGHLMGFNVVNYWGRNVDDLLVGRVLGATALGFYARAYELMLLPITEVSAVVGNAIFPILARMQDDLRRLRRIYLRANRLIAFVTFPAMAGLAVSAPSFVQVILGPGWEPVIPLLQILTVAGLVQSVGTTTGWIYKTTGRTDVMFRWGLAATVITVIVFLAVVRQGVFAVALAYTIWAVLSTGANLFIAGRLIGMPPTTIIAWTVRPALASAVMAVVVWLVTAIIPPSGPTVRLAAQVGVGVVTYTALSFLFMREILRELRDLVGSTRRTTQLERQP